MQTRFSSVLQTARCAPRPAMLTIPGRAFLRKRGTKTESGKHAAQTGYRCTPVPTYDLIQLAGQIGQCPQRHPVGLKAV